VLEQSGDVIGRPYSALVAPGWARDL